MVQYKFLHIYPTSVGGLFLKYIQMASPCLGIQESVHQVSLRTPLSWYLSGHLGSCVNTRCHPPGSIHHSLSTLQSDNLRMNIIGVRRTHLSSSYTPECLNHTQMAMLSTSTVCPAQKSCGHSTLRPTPHVSGMYLSCFRRDT